MKREITINKSNWSGDNSTIILDVENNLLVIADLVREYSYEVCYDKEIDCEYITVTDVETKSSYMVFKEEDYYVCVVHGLERTNEEWYTAFSQVMFNLY